MPTTHRFFASVSLAGAWLAALLPLQAQAGSLPAIEPQTSSAPSDLTLANFFSEGWNQAWLHRNDPDAAPDMALLRVQTNFLEREFRFDFTSERNIHSPSKDNVEFLDGIAAYSFNRRFMLEVISDYEWDNYRVGPDQSGAGAGVLARAQLVDTPDASYALNFRVTPPDTGVSQKQTTLSVALAGWNDLTKLGLPRVGLYYHVQEENYAGPGDPGEKRNDFTYDISLAKTWTRPDLLLLGNFTTFLEGYGVTNLDGADKGSTLITITPGVRTTLGHGNVLMAGIDVPLTNPHPYGVLYRLTYIINF